MLGGRHSGLSESVVRWLSRVHPTWEVVPEVSFNVWGERGIIDLVLWHPEHRALAVVELKTQLVDINELLGTLDRKRRLAAPAVRDRGWRPAIVAAWIIVADTRTNHRRVADHRTMLRSAYPADGRAMRTWLRDPYGPIAVLSMWAAG